eukprot:2287264-Amphidinium_carterae.1
MRMRMVRHACEQHKFQPGSVELHRSLAWACAALLLLQVLCVHALGRRPPLGPQRWCARRASPTPFVLNQTPPVQCNVEKDEYFAYVSRGAR